MNPRVNVSLAFSARINDDVLARAYIDGRQIGILTFRSREWFQIEQGNSGFYVLKPVDHRGTA